MAKCYECAYHKNIPGDAHISCVFNWTKAKQDMPIGAAHGINNGWYYFPFNYDPTWMLSECSNYAEQADVNMVRGNEGLLELLSMLR